MITLKLFELNWWDSFWEINVLKSVNKLFLVKLTKEWANLVFLLIFLFNFFTFQIWEKIKAKFSYVKEK